LSACGVVDRASFREGLKVRIISEIDDLDSREQERKHDHHAKEDSEDDAEHQLSHTALFAAAAADVAPGADVGLSRVEAFAGKHEEADGNQ